MLSLVLVAFGLILALLGCDRARRADNVPPTLMPTERVLVRRGAGPGSTLSIPRYKIHQDPDAPARIWVGLALEGAGPDTWYTSDAGGSWAPVAAMGWEMHMSLAGAGGYVHFIDRGTPAARYRRLFDGAFQPAAGTEFADYGAHTTSGNIAASGNEVVVFTRNRDDNADPIHWHRSTDDGMTWQDGVVAGTGNASGGLHRIGSCVIDGEITLVYWKESGGAGGDTLTLFRWSGGSFERVDGSFVTRTTSPYTRQFAITQDARGLVHLAVWDVVDGRRVVRHATRSLADGWSDPETVAAWDNDDVHPQLSAHGERVLLLYLYHPDSSAADRAQVYYRLWTPDAGWQLEGSPLYHGERAAARYPIAPQVASAQAGFIPVVWTQGAAVHYLRLELP